MVVSIIGIYEMRISGSLIEDMPKKAFFEDIVFFEKSLTNWCHLKYDWPAQKGVMKLSTLKRMEPEKLLMKVRIV
jgi:hypothetical protein